MEQRGIIGFDTLADFPTTGDVNYRYIDDSTQSVYYWSGSAYVVAPSAPGAVSWGGIGGTVSDQTDLQNALDAKVSKNDYNNNFLLGGM